MYILFSVLRIRPRRRRGTDDDGGMDPNAIEHRQLSSATTGETYARSAVLSEGLGLRSLFVHHDVVPPGTRASAAHRHSEREELVVVLSGTVTAWSDGAPEVISAGGVAAFPPGVSHYVENASAEPAEILVVASQGEHDRVSYP